MNKAHRVWCLVLLLACTTVSVWSGPPFSYDSALRSDDESVKTDTPKAERIYILGPDKVSETYLLNNKPTQHDVEVRRVVQWKPKAMLGSVLKLVPIDNTKELWVCVYRAGTEPDKPVFSVTFKDLSRLVIFPLQARDVILIKYTPPRGERPTPTI